MISLSRLKYSYARVRAAPPEPDKLGPPENKPPALASVNLGRMPWAWLGAVWPLVLHLIGAPGIAVLLIYYVDGNHFNIGERTPAVTFADGTTVRTSRFSPLQTDINTILSASLVVLRWVVAAWAGPLCWRTVFFLMEKTGLRRRDLEWLIGYGLFPPSTYLRHAFVAIVTAILTSILIAQSASPILTGSITWTPSNVPSGVHSNTFINVSIAENFSFPWQDYNLPYIQTKIGVKAAGYANQAWGRDIEKRISKRVLPSATRLNINSTIANVTLPYFQVTTHEWISDPQAHNLTAQTLYELGPPFEQGVLHFSETPGMLAIVPNAWRDMGDSRGVGAPVHDWPFPPPSTVSETRTLMLNAGQRSASAKISQSFPQNTGFVSGLTCYFAFAQVTYTAGVVVCTNCRLSSPSTVQSDSHLLLEPDTMTTEALWNMLNVTTFLLLMNASIPSPWENVDDYAMEVLARSYSGAWSALHDVMTDLDYPPLASRVYPTLQSLQAELDLRRVYAWLALQLLVTCTGFIFIWLQSGSKYALVGDTTMVAFDLDTTAAEARSLLRIEPKDDGWRVVVDPQSPPKSL